MRTAILLTAMLLAADASAAEAVAKRQFTNISRIYPPSCLQHRLPQTPSGPSTTTVASLPTSTGGAVTTQITIWRVACGPDAAAVMVTLVPQGATQGIILTPEIEFITDGMEIPMRLAAEPNTFTTDVLAFDASSGTVHTFVAEFGGVLILPGTPPPGTFPLPPPFDTTAAFDVLLRFGPAGVAQAQVAAYDPSAYPDVDLDLEISGYQTGAWYDPQHSGEGLLVEAVEQQDLTLVLAVTWFSFGPDGEPFWLAGATGLPANARTATVPLEFLQGGGFAGDFDPATVVRTAWGEMSLRFPDCNTLEFEFESTHSVAGFPMASGTRTWRRLTTINRLACE